MIASLMAALMRLPLDNAPASVRKLRRAIVRPHLVGSLRQIISADQHGAGAHVATWPIGTDMAIVLAWLDAELATMPRIGVAPLDDFTVVVSDSSAEMVAHARTIGELVPANTRRLTWRDSPAAYWLDGRQTISAAIVRCTTGICVITTGLGRSAIAVFAPQSRRR